MIKATRRSLDSATPLGRDARELMHDLALQDENEETVNSGVKKDSGKGVMLAVFQDSIL